MTCYLWLAFCYLISEFFFIAKNLFLSLVVVRLVIFKIVEAAALQLKKGKISDNTPKRLCWKKCLNFAANHPHIKIASLSKKISIYVSLAWIAPFTKSVLKLNSFNCEKHKVPTHDSWVFKEFLQNRLNLTFIFQRSRVLF